MDRARQTDHVYAFVALSDHLVSISDLGDAGDVDDGDLVHGDVHRSTEYSGWIELVKLTMCVHLQLDLTTWYRFMTLMTLEMLMVEISCMAM